MANCIKCELVKAKTIAFTCNLLFFTFGEMADLLNDKLGRNYFIRIRHFSKYDLVELMRNNSASPENPHLILSKTVKTDD